MIRIEISAAAYAALCAGVPEDRRFPAQTSPQGGFYLWLMKGVVNRLAALRGPGQSYSDAILKLAELEAA
jgi:hypothetical protein